jgi:hypothetical protein
MSTKFLKAEMLVFFPFFRKLVVTTFPSKLIQGRGTSLVALDLCLAPLANLYYPQFIQRTFLLHKAHH